MADAAPPRASSVLRAATTNHTHQPVAAVREHVVSAGILVMVLLACAIPLLGTRLARRHVTSLSLVIVLIGAVLLLMLELPVGGRAGWVGTCLFLGLGGVYKLLGRLELPEDR
jgi:hypothetical protein